MLRRLSIASSAFFEHYYLKFLQKPQKLIKIHFNSQTNRQDPSTLHDFQYQTECAKEEHENLHVSTQFSAILIHSRICNIMKNRLNACLINISVHLIETSILTIIKKRRSLLKKTSWSSICHYIKLIFIHYGLDFFLPQRMPA